MTYGDTTVCKDVHVFTCLLVRVLKNKYMGVIGVEASSTCPEEDEQHMLIHFRQACRLLEVDPVMSKHNPLV